MSSPLTARELAEQHNRLSRQYAQLSHRHEGALGNAYSAAAEAHTQLASALEREAEAGEDEPPSPAPAATDSFGGLTAGLGRRGTRR